MMFLSKHHKRQEGVKLVLLDKMSIKRAASVVGMRSSELACWVQLYEEHGHQVFEPCHEHRFELELFKLRYPEGIAQVTFKRAFIDYIHANKARLLRAGLALMTFEALIALRWWWDWSGLSDDRMVTYYVYGLPSVVLNARAFAVGFTLSFLPLCFVLALSMLTLRDLHPLRLLSSKLEHVSYLRERRKMSKHERLGALQIVAATDRRGGLAVAHERGELSVFDHDSASAQEDAQASVEVEAPQVCAASQSTGQ